MDYHLEPLRRCKEAPRFRFAMNAGEDEAGEVVTMGISTADDDASILPDARRHPVTFVGA